MDFEIPYLRIRDFESQALEKLLDQERPEDKPVFVEAKNTQAKSSRKGFHTGDCYSKSVDLILETIGLAKYIENFKANDVGVNVLVHMDEDDLAEIGITDFMDQLLFKKKLGDFHGPQPRPYRSEYKIEEDLIMAQNICSHLEDINSHLNLVQFFLRNNKYEDYFVNPRKSILGIYNIVMDRALVQAKRMKDVLFTGSLKRDALIPALLKDDNLQLPDYMATKLYKPDKSFRVKPKKNFFPTIAILTILSAAFSAFAIVICRGNK